MEVFVFLGWIVFAFIVGGFASSRGRSGAGWGFLALIISPLIAFIVLLVIPDVAAQDRERREREQAAAHAAQVSATEARRVQGADVALRIEKLRQLKEKGLLTEPEYLARKQKVFNDLQGKQLVESSEDFLALLLPLIDSGALTQDETSRLKAFAFQQDAGGAAAQPTSTPSQPPPYSAHRKG